jgi:anti-sigma factor RsiW
MTATWDCQEARIALGVYVLGAIDPDERAAVDDHLDTCPQCRAELAEFMELPGLLALVPSEEAIALADGPLPGDPPLLPPVTFLGRPRDALPLGAAAPLEATAPYPTLPPPAVPPVLPSAVPLIPGAPDAVLARFPAPAQVAGGTAIAGDTGEPPAQGAGGTAEPRPANVVDLAAARRRRRRLASVAAVAAAAVVIGGASFGGAKLAASPAPVPAQQGLAQDLHPAGAPNGGWQTVTGSNGHAAAAIAYQSMRWGTLLAAKVSGLPVDTPCQMWVVRGDGTRQLAGSWVTDSDEGNVWYPSSAGATATDIKSFVITVQGGQPITVTI